MQTLPQQPPHKLGFGSSFFLFGLVNNVLYVVILSAALDLLSTVPGEGSTPPKGLILAANIAPAFAVKVLGPYIHGNINYPGRITFCSALSFVGILIVASSSSLLARLFGIALASFSSGLGEMTYLQLSTVYGSLSLPYDLGGIAVGWFASGTGAAGLVGAGLWWLLRGLGVRQGLLICSFMPLGMAATYFGLLPKVDKFVGARDAYDIVRDLSSEDEDDELLAESRAAPPLGKVEPVHLTIADKLQLVKPLLVRFCLPLFTVYWAEYTINQGVAPTLLYAIPDPTTNPVLASIFKTLSDYYVTWQLVYQAFVFVSRSSLSIFHLPPLPLALLPLPTLIQLCLLAITALESSTGVISLSLGDGATTWIVMLLISLEGLCGGAAYVNAFYHLGHEMDEEEGDSLDGKDSHRRAQEREFRIASVGVFDTLGILLASGTASLVEPRLCRAQQARGKMLCKGL